MWTITIVVSQETAGSRHVIEMVGEFGLRHSQINTGEEEFSPEIGLDFRQKIRNGLVGYRYFAAVMNSPKASHQTSTVV